MAEKFSVSTSAELYQALEELCQRRGQSRSQLIEKLLREHPMVRREVRRQRREQEPPPRRRDPDELHALARAARRRWTRRAQAGEVAFLDR
jgi:hypothetical protein